MTLPSSRLFDILNGSQLSSFLLLEDSIPYTSCSYFWPTLLKRLGVNYKCLILRTELPGCNLPCSIPPGAEEISFWQFENVPDFFKAVENKISFKSPGSRPWAIFFESLDAFLNECPREHDITDWGRLVSSRILSLTISPSVATTICSVNLYKSPSGELSWCSEQVKEIFEFSASTCVRVISTPSPTQIDVAFWHRRTLDSMCKGIRLFPDLPPTNKPAVSGLCRLTLDSQGGTIIGSRDIEKPNDEVMPTSTFKLTLSEEEMEAKRKVILPYMSAINPPASSAINIDYEPDEFDDLDDEDPDDDLDI
ncbi:hypothetical protein Aperf_G00000005469 [Anoplocephala perfoliata]